jgi:hypothetical protein
MPAPFEPVSAEELAHLHELTSAEEGLADQIYNLEMEKISFLAAGKRLREDKAALYRRVAKERGIPEDADMNIHLRTGEVMVRARLRAGDTQPAPIQPAPSAET